MPMPIAATRGRMELEVVSTSTSHAKDTFGLAGDPQYLPALGSSTDPDAGHSEPVTRLRTYARADIAAEQWLMKRCGRHLEGDRGVVRLVAMGMPHDVIGGLVGVKPKTVKDLVGAAARRLGVPSGSGPGYLVTVAFARRLLLPGMFDERWPGPSRELTGRELESVRWAARGETYDQIGRRLYLSPSSVRAGMACVREVYGARNLANLIARCHLARTLRLGDVEVPA